MIGDGAGVEDLKGRMKGGLALKDMGLPVSSPLGNRTASVRRRLDYRQKGAVCLTVATICDGEESVGDGLERRADVAVFVVGREEVMAGRAA